MHFSLPRLSGAPAAPPGARLDLRCLCQRRPAAALRQTLREGERGRREFLSTVLGNSFGKFLVAKINRGSKRHSPLRTTQRGRPSQ